MSDVAKAALAFFLAHGKKDSQRAAYRNLRSAVRSIASSDLETAILHLRLAQDILTTWRKAPHGNDFLSGAERRVCDCLDRVWEKQQIVEALR